MLSATSRPATAVSFAITKLRSSGPSVWTSLNDAMIFGYYGTSSYSSFNNLNYTNFLTAVDAMAPNSEADTRWAVGLLGSPIRPMFAGEKYALVPDPARFQTAAQYEFIRRYGKDYLFRNKLFLPLGLTFHQFRRKCSGSFRATKGRKSCSVSSCSRTRRWRPNMAISAVTSPNWSANEGNSAALR